MSSIGFMYKLHVPKQALPYVPVMLIYIYFSLYIHPAINVYCVRCYLVMLTHYSRSQGREIKVNAKVFSMPELSDLGSNAR